MIDTYFAIQGVQKEIISYELTTQGIHKGIRNNELATKWNPQEITLKKINLKILLNLN